jgi:hypothetical protein
MLVASIYALLNFIAAASLGYDLAIEGTAILRGWGYGALGCFAAAVVSAAIAWREWRR